MLTANLIKQFASLKQKKYRLEYSQFLIEGFHLVEECLNSDYELEYIILRSDINLQGHTGILEKIAKNKTIVEPLPEKQFNKLTDTESSQGIVGIVKRNFENTPPQDTGLIIALDRISDPGNLGTIIRTAYWFGVNTIMLSRDCADPYNPKVIRSTQGGIFHTDIVEDADLLTELKRLEATGYEACLFTLDAERYLAELRKDNAVLNSSKSILVFGNESHGISQEIIDAGFRKVKIRGYSQSESLNAAISCAIALYEFTR
ncbi:MAG: RNA methyltransferase [Ignavibacteria bacterium]|nr:RNA methyltransferase [Ignavibacteria bacterium]